jgi:hypothetical protein
MTTALNATRSPVRSCDGVTNVRPGFHDATARYAALLGVELLDIGAPCA